VTWRSCNGSVAAAVERGAERETCVNHKALGFGYSGVIMGLVREF